MTRPEKPRVPVVHAVTTDEVISDARFIEKARGVMEALGHRGAVHLRCTHISVARLYAIAEELAAAQRATESWLVINDRVDIALAVAARAVQLTSRSLPVRDVLPIASGMAVGASIHTLDEAVYASREGASWIVAGHVYLTPSHESERGRGEEFVAEVAWRVPTPVIAIGGITPAHVPALRLAGAHGVAAIRGIWDAGDAAAAATHYLSSYDADGS